MAARRVKAGQVLAAARADLRVLGKQLPGVQRSVEARVVERLAADLDGNVDAPLSARASAARELREAMAVLRGRVPEAKEADRLDELAAQREKRVAAR